MKSITPVLHTRGALYTTTEEFDVYSCPECLSEVTNQFDKEPNDFLLSYITQAFEKWDRGDAFGDWFRYLGEGSPEDINEDVFDLGLNGGESA